MKKITFREAWLVFGAQVYTGYRTLEFIPKNIPPWTEDADLPDLTHPPNEL